MNASSQAARLVAELLGHNRFRVLSAESGWHYRASQNVEWMLVETERFTMPVVALLESGVAEFVAIDESPPLDRCPEVAAALSRGLAEARLSNERMRSLEPLNDSDPTPPRPIRRVFLFATSSGLEHGFAREEFGDLEPFLSARV